MLIALVLAVLALALWFPDNRIGGALRRLLIDEPVRRLNDLKRGHVLLALGIVAILATAYAIGRQEGVALVGQATADTLVNTVGLGIDLVTWLDVTAIGLIIAATVRFREAIGLAAVQARQWARRCARVLVAALASRSRARRPRGATRPRHGEDPDRPAPAFAWA
jgi:hypothetical protein